jgi:hypothetical protein
LFTYAVVLANQHLSYPALDKGTLTNVCLHKINDDTVQYILQASIHEYIPSFTSFKDHLPPQLNQRHQRQVTELRVSNQLFDTLEVKAIPQQSHSCVEIEVCGRKVLIFS